MPRVTPLPRQRASKQQKPSRWSGSIGLLASDDLAPKQIDRLVVDILAHQRVLLALARPGIACQVGRGVVQAGGPAIGFSTAATMREHVEKMHWPYDDFSTIIYTGLDYEGCQQMMLSAADWLMLIPGRQGSMHTMVSEIEGGSQKVGILLPAGHSSHDVARLLDNIPRASVVVYDSDIDNLLQNMERKHQRSATRLD